MSTRKIWDLHIHFDGPITEEFAEGTRQLPKSIAQ